MVRNFIAINILGRRFRCETDADIDSDVRVNYISTGMIEHIENESGKPFLIRQKFITGMFLQTKNLINFIIAGSCYLLIKVENQRYFKKFLVIQHTDDILTMKNL